MMALSIRQPWAWLILHGGKDIENRDWPTKFRGRFLVHAAKGMTRAEYDEANRFYEGIRRDWHIVGEEPPPLPAFDDLERGGFVGSVELVDVHHSRSSPWFVGDFGYVLKDPRPFKLVPYKGRLGFFDVNLLATFDRFKDSGVTL